MSFSGRKRISKSFLDEDEDDPFDLENSPKRANKDTRKKTPKAKNENLFEQTLRESGLVLDKSDDPNMQHFIFSDQAVFQKKFSSALRRFLNPDHVGCVITEVIELLESSDIALYKALNPTKTDSSCLSARSIVQDSLVRLLLGIDEIHDKLSEWMLEKLALISLENEDPTPVGDNNVLKNLPQLILSQLKWLDRGVMGQSLVSKILEILEASSAIVQHEIIASLPEIVDDSHHTRIAMALRDKLSTDGYHHKLTNAILDTLSNLTLPHEDTAEIRDSILKTMSVMSMDDLPVIVRFILNSIESGEEFEVISNLRSELQLAPPPAAALSQISQPKSDPRDIDMIVLDIIRISMTGNSKLGDAWFRSIDGNRDGKPLDILVLLILHSLPNRFRVVESSFKNKVRQGVFNFDLIDKTFKKHSIPLRQSFDSLTSIAESMMQNNEPALNQMATHMICDMFIHLDRYFQHEIISGLVTKVSSGSNVTLRQTSLSTLDALSAKHTAEMCPYAILASGVLDLTDSMALDDVRRVMDILSRLAFSPFSKSSSLKDDLLMIVRKQIFCGKNQLKRMGVVGAVSIVKNITIDQSDLSSDSESSSSGSRPVSLSGSLSSYKLAQQVLELAREATVSVGDVAGLLMDELASLVIGQKLDISLIKWISETMTNSFISEYIVDVVEDKTTIDDEYVPLEILYPLIMSDNSPIAVNLGPLVIRNLKSGLQKCSRESTAANRLIPHFRLLAVCEFAKGEDNLSNLDALLGCPIWMPKAVLIDKFESLSVAEKNVVLTCIFYCINWFRELLNCFTRSKASEDLELALARIKNILKLEELLLSLLPKNLGFVPPCVLPLVDYSSWQPLMGIPKVTNGLKKISGKGKGKGLKRKTDDTMAISQTQLNSQRVEPSQADVIDPNSGELSNLDHYKPFFRELDVEVSKLISLEKVTLAPDSSFESVGNVKLRPPELLFLLKDLESKIRRSLVGSKTKKGFPGKTNVLKNVGYTSLDAMGPDTVARFVIKNLDHTMTHLEEIARYFKEIIEMNDGIIDGPIVFNQHTPCLVECFEKSVLCIKGVFTWNGFQSHHHRRTLREALHKIANRSKRINPEAPLRDLISNCFDHLSLFADSVINVGVADAYLKLLEAIVNCDPDGENDRMTKQIWEIADIFLKREWRNPNDGSVEKGRNFNLHVESILSVYFALASDKMEALAEYKLAMDEILSRYGQRDAKASEILTFTKQNLPIHYKVMFNELNICIRELTYTKTKEKMRLLEEWSSTVPIFCSLVTLPKRIGTRVFVSMVLKQSRVYVDAFIKNCMQLVDDLFGSHRELCIKLVKEAQTGTRYLQHVCQHSKTQKEVSLSNYVPALKKSLETFVYRVKVTLALHNAVGGFWLGNLKNRKLDGEEIQTQAPDTETNTEDGEEEEEQDPVDEEDQSDVEMDGNASSPESVLDAQEEADITIF